MQIRTSTESGKMKCSQALLPSKLTCAHPPRRAGRFGTKGLAITFVSTEDDQKVLDAIQSRFEVAIPDLPDTIESSTYSELSCFTARSRSAANLIIQ